jgi:hypothetical protein
MRVRVSLDLDILIESFISLTGYDIVYLDETWVNQNHCTYYMWLPNDGSDAPKIPSGKGKRLIDGCDLVFLAKSKDGDYHQEMNSFVFLEWFENQLMPAVVLFLATKPLTCAHINSIWLHSVSNGGSYYFMSV